MASEPPKESNEQPYPSLEDPSVARTDTFKRDNVAQSTEQVHSGSSVSHSVFTTHPTYQPWNEKKSKVHQAREIVPNAATGSFPPDISHVSNRVLTQTNASNGLPTGNEVSPVLLRSLPTANAVHAAQARSSTNAPDVTFVYNSSSHPIGPYDVLTSQKRKINSSNPGYRHFHKLLMQHATELVNTLSSNMMTMTGASVKYEDYVKHAELSVKEVAELGGKFLLVIESSEVSAAMDLFYYVIQSHADAVDKARLGIRNNVNKTLRANRINYQQNVNQMQQAQLAAQQRQLEQQQMALKAQQEELERLRRQQDLQLKGQTNSNESEIKESASKTIPGNDQDTQSRPVQVSTMNKPPQQQSGSSQLSNSFAPTMNKVGPPPPMVVDSTLNKSQKFVPQQPHSGSQQIPPATSFPPTGHQVVSPPPSLVDSTLKTSFVPQQSHSGPQRIPAATSFPPTGNQVVPSPPMVVDSTLSTPQKFVPQQIPAVNAFPISGKKVVVPSPIVIDSKMNTSSQKYVSQPPHSGTQRIPAATSSPPTGNKMPPLVVDGSLMYRNQNFAPRPPQSYTQHIPVSSRFAPTVNVVVPPPPPPREVSVIDRHQTFDARQPQMYPQQIPVSSSFAPTMNIVVPPPPSTQQTIKKYNPQLHKVGLPTTRDKLPNPSYPPWQAKLKDLPMKAKGRPPKVKLPMSTQKHPPLLLAPKPTPSPNHQYDNSYPRSKFAQHQNTQSDPPRVEAVTTTTRNIVPAAAISLNATAKQIEKALPPNASSIMYLYDRRINFDHHPSDTSTYALLRSWIQDDPYRHWNQNVNSETLLELAAMNNTSWEGTEHPKLDADDSSISVEVDYSTNKVNSQSPSRERMQTPMTFEDELQDRQSSSIPDDRTKPYNVTQTAPKTVLHTGIDVGNNSIEQLKLEMIQHSRKLKRNARRKFLERDAMAMQSLRHRGIPILSSTLS
jgi:hypothetical protein